MQLIRMKTGFTLVELSISIVFIAILSLAVVLTITNTIASYRRGLIINQINTTGTDIVDDMMTAVQSSPAQSLKDECAMFYGSSGQKTTCENNGGLNFTMVVKKGSVKIGTKNITSVPLFGAFCTGNYSYIWNSGYYFDDKYAVTSGAGADSKGRAVLQFSDDKTYDEVMGQPIKLIKVKDEGRSVCRSVLNVNSYSSNISNVFKLNAPSTIRNSEPELFPEEMIAKESGLALYSVDVGLPAMGANSRSMLYPVSFILGTIQGGINVRTSGDSCAPPADGARLVAEYFDYCSINKFNFAAQAIGG